MWVFTAAVGVVGLGMGSVAVAIVMSLRKHVCPSCNARALRCVATRSVWATGDRGHIQRMYRCLACRAEHMRQGKGPLVPREMWDAGARGELPPARIVDR